MSEPIERAIVVNGEATVRRVPDLAVVSLAVTVRGKQPAPARDDANRRASAILARLRELGLPEADVYAPSLVVHPTYDYGRGGPKVTGYEASRPMTLRIRDVELLAPVLDGLVDDGATQVHGTAMELAEPEAATREALASAVAVARSRAEALAEASGVSLGEPLRVEEGESMSGPIRPVGMMRMAAAQEAAPTEVAAGEIGVTARVRVWFAIG
ncbi:MAG TPA: SIMPL domain-containing protein [Candidatus Limnocylindrales bacterium]|nr:SIMPL domain-containing protein [Candidatus Limnocylindrales bacterium]